MHIKYLTVWPLNHDDFEISSRRTVRGRGRRGGHLHLGTPQIGHEAAEGGRAQRTSVRQNILQDPYVLLLLH